MPWNWQQPDWPHFTWNAVRLRKAEETFLLGSGRFAGTIQHLGPDDRDDLAVEAMSTEAVTTSAIEGEVLDRASVKSSIRRQLGLSFDRRQVKAAEQGVAEMMVSLYRTFEEPLSDKILFEWHRMLTNGRRDLKNVGVWRTGAEPTQVVSGAIYAPRVHFEAPSASVVPEEMDRFIRWFNESSPSGKNPLPAITRTGIAHLYFESIHPFEDGNGRLGRAISEKALAQAVGQPTLTALAATILLRRKAYYAALEAANKSNEVTEWLCWFAAITIEARRRAEANVEFLIDKARLLDRLLGVVNERQEKAILRMLREGPEEFRGGLSAGNYASMTGASAATTTRDLADLVVKGALRRTGELRHARYRLAVELRAVPAVDVDSDGSLRTRREDNRTNR